MITVIIGKNLSTTGNVCLFPLKILGHDESLSQTKVAFMKKRRHTLFTYFAIGMMTEMQRKRKAPTSIEGKKKKLV